MTSLIRIYSIALLIVTSTIHVQCATDKVLGANEELFKDDTQVHDGTTENEQYIKNTHKEHVDGSEKSNKICDRENCDNDLSASSSYHKQNGPSSTEPEQGELKADKNVDEFDSGPDELAENRVNVDRTDFNLNEKVNEKSSYNEQNNIVRSAVEGKDDHSFAIETERGNEKISDITQKIESSIDKPFSESNSTFYRWLKFLLDPIIEEFKDGIYPKVSDKANNTLSNVSVAVENATLNIEAANITLTEPSNITETENVTDSGKKVKFQCTGKNITENVNATVKLITTAQLLQMLSFEKNDTENVTDCLLVMFYAPWCHFCAKIAPYYNALARAFPQLDFVAVDTAQFSNLLARFGTVSVPNILVFHQSRAAVKFNQTERTFKNLVTFITNSTGLEPNNTVNVTEADYLGPVPSVPTNDQDYLLLISWIFVIFCSTCIFVKSNKGQQWINRVRILWQEHQHID